MLVINKPYHHGYGRVNKWPLLNKVTDTNVSNKCNVLEDSIL